MISRQHTLLCTSVALLFSASALASPPPRTAGSGAYEPIGHEILHKLSIQAGYGPEDSALGNDRESFHNVTYEPTFIWYSPEKRWSEWMVFGRANLTYDSGNSSNTLASDNQNLDARERPEYLYAEAREFYVRRNLLGGDPRFALSLGRQAYNDKYGLFWDDSIESVRLSYNDTFARGFFAVGQKFWNYNSDVNSLDAGEEETLYVMGEYALRWHADHWAGVRALYEDDRSDNDPDDPQDFTGWRAGLFLRGENLTFSPLLSDYHVELAALGGRIGAIDNSLSRSSHNTRGAAMVSEIGKRFDHLTWTPRVALRGGITDTPSDENDGFYLNRMQSDRIVTPGSYNTRLVSSFIRLNLRNVQYYGASLELKPTPRSALDLRISDVYLRSADGDLPVRISRTEQQERRAEIRAGTFNGGRSVGQVYDANYYWRMFPLAYEGRHLNINGLINVAYLDAGSAVPSGNDYQLSFGIVATY